MQDKVRLYWRPNGRLLPRSMAPGIARACKPRMRPRRAARLPPGTKPLAQPVFNMEMAKAYLRAHDPMLCERTGTTVSDAVQQTYEGRPKPVGRSSLRVSRWPSCLARSSLDASTDFLPVLNHPEAGVSTNASYGARADLTSSPLVR